MFRTVSDVVCDIYASTRPRGSSPGVDGVAEHHAVRAAARKESGGHQDHHDDQDGPLRMQQKVGVIYR